MRLPDKVAIVTGAGSGIGRATAQLFAAEGAAVVCADRAAEGGHATVAAITAAGGKALFTQTDVSDSAQIAQMVEAAATFGGVDILMNNAAIGGGGRLVDLTDDIWDRIIAVNLTAVFRCTRAVVPHMLRRGGGSVINISSVMAFTSLPDSAAYSAAKAGILGFTRAVALDLAPQGIRVNAIAPGSTDTPMMWAGVSAADLPAITREMEAAIPFGRLADPMEIARAALFLASDDASFVTGTCLSVDGGQLAKFSAPR